MECGGVGRGVCACTCVCASRKLQVLHSNSLLLVSVGDTDK